MLDDLRFCIKWANREKIYHLLILLFPLQADMPASHWRGDRRCISESPFIKLYCVCDLNHIFPNIFNAKYGILVLDTFRNDSNCVAKIKAIFCGAIFTAKCGILACTAVCYDANCDFKISHRMQYIKIWCHQRELTSTLFQDKNIALQWPF